MRRLLDVCYAVKGPDAAGVPLDAVRPGKAGAWFLLPFLPLLPVCIASTETAKRWFDRRVPG